MADKNCGVCMLDVSMGFEDCVSCSGCNGSFHVNCLKWSATAIKKSKNRGFQYLCDSCKSPKTPPKTVGCSVSEMTEVMSRLLKEQTDEIISNFQEIQKQKFKEVDDKFADHELRIDALEKKVHPTTQEVSAVDGKYRKSLMIHNVPVMIRNGAGKEEIYSTIMNISSSLNVELNMCDIGECYRLKQNKPARNNIPPIVVQFNSAYHRDSVWNNYMKFKNLKLSDAFTMTEVDSRIYINPLLSPDQYKIKNAILRYLIRPNLALQYWYKSKSYHVQKDKNSAPFPVKSFEEILSLADEWKHDMSGESSLNSTVINLQ